MKITQDDLLEALNAALASPATVDAPTALELAVEMACGEKKVWKALRALAAAGRLEVVKVQRVDLAGRTQLVPGYRIKKAKRAA